MVCSMSANSTKKSDGAERKNGFFQVTGNKRKSMTERCVSSATVETVNSSVASIVLFCFVFRLWHSVLADVSGRSEND